VREAVTGFLVLAAALVVSNATPVLHDDGVVALLDVDADHKNGDRHNAGDTESTQAERRREAVAKIREIIAPGQLDHMPESVGEAADSMEMSPVAKKRMSMLEEEISRLQRSRHTVAEQTMIKMRTRANRGKERYFKRMKGSSQFRSKLGKMAEQAARKVVKQTVRAGKYFAINKVLEKRAAYVQGLRDSLQDMTGKLHSTLQATEELTSQAAKDESIITDLKAKVAKAQAEQGLHPNGDSTKKLTLEQQIKREKKLARNAHMKAADFHAKAGDAHAKAGSKTASDAAHAAAKKSQDAANADNLRVDDGSEKSDDPEDVDSAKADKAESTAEDDEEEAKAAEEKAKKLKKAAKKAKRKAKKEKKAAKKIAKAKKKAEKLQEKADKAKEEAADDGGDDDGDDE